MSAAWLRARADSYSRDTLALADDPATVPVGLMYRIIATELRAAADQADGQQTLPLDERIVVASLEARTGRPVETVTTNGRV